MRFGSCPGPRATGSLQTGRLERRCPSEVGLEVRPKMSLGPCPDSVIRPTCHRSRRSGRIEVPWTRSPKIDSYSLYCTQGYMAEFFNHCLNTVKVISITFCSWQGQCAVKKFHLVYRHSGFEGCIHRLHDEQDLQESKIDHTRIYL